jgi:hypothetical protein
MFMLALISNLGIAGHKYFVSLFFSCHMDTRRYQTFVLKSVTFM